MTTLEYNAPAFTLRDRLDYSQKADVADVVNYLFAAMAGGRKIEAIKAFRSLTGEGLKVSKDAVESVMVSPVAKPVEDAEYAYGYYVMTRSNNPDSNEYDAYDWRCNERDCTLGYARVRANDVCEMAGEGETVFIMKQVARSVTTTSMKDM